MATTFQFSVALGGDLQLTKGTASFYGLQDGEPVDLGSLTVTSPGFTMDLDREAYPYFYVVLQVEECDRGHASISVSGRDVLLLSVFRQDELTVSLGERETIANTFCFARFAASTGPSNISIAATDREMGLMCGMRDNFIASDGTLSAVISSAPNAGETNSYAMFNYLANLLYHCIVDSNVYSQFLSLSSSESTFQAFLHMVLHPWDNVQVIYDLIEDKTQVYTPALPEMYTSEQRERWSPVPNQWTLTIKVHDSGAQNFLIAGPGYIAFDENDRAWISNNVTQGTPTSSSFCVILNPDGSPTEFSPLFGGGLLGGGFGATANAEGSRIFFGNYGWGTKDYNPQHGSISVIDSDGTLVSPPNGYIAGLSRVQGLIYDQEGNLWITSWGTQKPMAPVPGTTYDFHGEPSAIVVYLNFDGSKAPEPEDVLVYAFEDPSPFKETFDVVIDSQGYAFVSNSGSKVKDPKDKKKEVIVGSSVYKLRINKDDPDHPFIECVAKWPEEEDTCETLRQINVNARDEVFVAGVGAGGVLKFDNDLGADPVLYSNKIGRPWGVTFDKDDTMYVANFFPLHESPPEDGERDMRGQFGVTVIWNGDEDTAEIMTLPTGGDPVTLANGFGLYGSGNPPSYQPLSRLTGTVIDRVGNLWAINNWKPSAYNDFEANPGGDGIVIFIGVARPNPRD